MSAFVSLRANAWMVAIGFALTVAMPSAAKSSQVMSSAAIAFQKDRTSAEPFGLATIALPGEGSLAAKWRTVDAAIKEDLKVIAVCRADRANCSSQPALAFLKIVDSATALTGLARIGEINRAFNLSIRAMSDQAQYGVEDVWTSPLATLAAGAGDCEDYAIAKMVALREAGLSADDLRLVFLHDAISGEDHAVVAARVDNHWRMLDNRVMLMLEDSDVTKLQPTFAFDAEGAKRFVDPAFAVAALAAKDAVKTVAAEETAKETAANNQPIADAAIVMADLAMPFEAYFSAM